MRRENDSAAAQLSCKERQQAERKVQRELKVNDLSLPNALIPDQGRTQQKTEIGAHRPVRVRPSSFERRPIGTNSIPGCLDKFALYSKLSGASSLTPTPEAASAEVSSYT